MLHGAKVSRSAGSTPLGDLEDAGVDRPISKQILSRPTFLGTSPSVCDRQQFAALASTDLNLQPRRGCSSLLCKSINSHLADNRMLADSSRAHSANSDAAAASAELVHGAFAPDTCVAIGRHDAAGNRATAPRSAARCSRAPLRVAGQLPTVA